MKKSFQLSAVSYQHIAPVLSAALLILAFPPFNLWFLAWVGLVPLFYAIDGVRPVQAFRRAYTTGAIFFAGTVWWLIHVTLPGTAGAVMYLALYIGIFGLIVSMVPFRGSWARLLFVPAVWVALEYLRSVGIFGFGWNLLAYSQAPALPIIQIADITGAYGVSFLVVLVNAALYRTLRGFAARDYATVHIGLAVLVLFAALVYGTIRVKNIFAGDVITVAVVQGNIPQDQKWDTAFREEILAKYEMLTKEAAQRKPDLIVWPETSVPGFLTSERDLMERVQALAAAVAIPILIGAPREDEASAGTIYNSTFLFAEDGSIAGRYDKIHLVPFGEYVPFKSVFSFVEKFAPRPIGDFSGGNRYTVFNFFIQRTNAKKAAIWKVMQKVRFSSLICFEDIFPGLARTFVAAGARFLVVMTNDAWFHKTAAAYQHTQGSVFRAVENRVNLVRAANTGLSCFIDQKGNLTAPVVKNGERLFVDGFSVNEITLTNTRTFYTVFGDVFAYLCILGSILTLLARYCVNIKKS